MADNVLQGVEECRAGTNSAMICRLPSGWAVLANLQYLSGYSLLLPDPVVTSLNDLDRTRRAEYLCDMVTIGDALMEVTGAFRINYAVMGNTDPRLHAHIVPRFLSEPQVNRQDVPWSYSTEIKEGRPFDLSRDQDLIASLAVAIKKRLD